jgi:hypothetical protein
VSGELALESIGADGPGQHEPGGRLERRRRDRAERHRAHGPEAAGAHVVELLLVFHAKGIDRRNPDL